MDNKFFCEMLADKGAKLYRDMPWRDDTRPYYVLVSELMLQQTQVSRVIPKFDEFIRKFPDERALAVASLDEVLKAWQGLGYNRRAKFLHEAAKKIVEQDAFPEDERGLLVLPGVGKNTAGAILAYSFNKPALFIETNIRTVYIHHFFNDQFDVDDIQIIAKLSETIDHNNPRAFYWSLMDYGAWLKANGVRNIASSRHYKKQPPLKGSVREVRGQVVRLLTVSGQSLTAIQSMYENDERLTVALESLEKDGLITKRGDVLHLTN